MKFHKITLPHFHSFYIFALVVAKNGHDAEDLVQETYLRVYSKFDQFDYETNVKAWMFRILRNIAIVQLRKKDALVAAKNEEQLTNTTFFATIARFHQPSQASQS